MRVALGQILVEAGKREANMARALSAIDSAASLGADALVLPECMDLGWLCSDAAPIAEAIDGPSVSLLAAHAASAGIMVAAGLTEYCSGALYNAAVLIDRDGKVVGRHRKINELDFARSNYAIGRKLEVFQTSLGAIALAICADLLEPAIGEAIAAMGAQIIFSPCAWAVPVDHDEIRSPYGDEWRRAYQNLAGHGVAVASASNVGRIDSGEWKGRRVIGRSLMVHADGAIAGQGAFDREDLPMFELRYRQNAN